MTSRLQALQCSTVYQSKAFERWSKKGLDPLAVIYEAPVDLGLPEFLDLQKEDGAHFTCKTSVAGPPSSLGRWAWSLTASLSCRVAT